jgi:hypothetical protein
MVSVVACVQHQQHSEVALLQLGSLKERVEHQDNKLKVQLRTVCVCMIYTHISGAYTYK